MILNRKNFVIILNKKIKVYRPYAREEKPSLGWIFLKFIAGSKVDWDCVQCAIFSSGYYP